MVRPCKDTPPLQQGMGTATPMLESGNTQVPCRAADSTAWSREESQWVCKLRVRGSKGYSQRSREKRMDKANLKELDQTVTIEILQEKYS